MTIDARSEYLKLSYNISNLGNNKLITIDCFTIGTNGLNHIVVSRCSHNSQFCTLLHSRTTNHLVIFSILQSQLTILGRKDKYI